MYQCSGSGSVGSVCFWASRINIRIRRWEDPHPDPYSNVTDPLHIFRLKYSNGKKMLKFGRKIFSRLQLKKFSELNGQNFSGMGLAYLKICQNRRIAVSFLHLSLHHLSERTKNYFFSHSRGSEKKLPSKFLNQLALRVFMYAVYDQRFVFTYSLDWWWTRSVL